VDINQQLDERGLRTVIASEVAERDGNVDLEYLWTTLDSSIYVVIEGGHGLIKARRHVVRHLFCESWLFRKDTDELFGMVRSADMDGFLLVRLNELPDDLLDPWLLCVRTMLSDDEVVEMNMRHALFEYMYGGEQVSELAEIETMLRAKWDALTTPLFFTENCNLMRHWQGRWWLLRTCDESGLPNDLHTWTASNTDIEDWRFLPIEHWRRRDVLTGVNWQEEGF
jgi:hypothetical protein